MFKRSIFRCASRPDAAIPVPVGAQLVTARGRAQSVALPLVTSVGYTAAAMRRLVLIVLLLILPLQWSWATVASACRHETGSAAQHLGHHAHEHDHDQGLVDGHGHAELNSALELTTAGDDAAGPDIHTDCATCHGNSVVDLINLPAPHPTAASKSAFDAYDRLVLDHIPQRLLRPPRALAV